MVSYIYYNTNNQTKKIFNVIIMDKFGKSIEIESEQLLIARGRIPNLDLLNIEKENIKLNENGFILADDYLQTHIDGIYAIGDVIGKYQCMYNAKNEAHYAFNNILYPDNKSSVNYNAIPHAIFTSPQISGVGYTEQQLRKRR